MTAMTNRLASITRLRASALPGLRATALLAFLLAALAARAGGEFKAHGFTLPGGSVKLDDGRYRLAQAWDDVKRFYRSVYPAARFPRRVLPNQSGIRAEHIENP